MRNICWNQWLQWQFIMMLIKRGIAWFSPMTARWPDLTELECFYINYNAHDKTQSGIMVIILRGSNCLYNCNKISPSPPQDMICNNEWVERMNCFLVTSLDHLPTVLAEQYHHLLEISSDNLPPHLYFAEISRYSGDRMVISIQWSYL